MYVALSRVTFLEGLFTSDTIGTNERAQLVQTLERKPKVTNTAC